MHKLSKEKEEKEQIQIILLGENNNSYGRNKNKQYICYFAEKRRDSICIKKLRKNTEETIN